MTEWKGFVIESKIHMGYPGYRRCGDEYFAGDHRPQMSGEEWARTRPERRRKKIEFWLVFPYAWLRFHWFMLRDLIARAKEAA